MHVEREQFQSLHAVIERYAGYDTAGGGAAVAAEGEVSEAVENHSLFVTLDPLENMGVVAQYHVGTGIYGGVGGCYLIAGGGGRAFRSPME